MEYSPLHFGGYGMAVLVFGPTAILSKLADIRKENAGSARENSALLALDGQRGTITLSASRTSWIIKLAADGELIAALQGTGQNKAYPSQNITNGAGHWVTLITASLARASAAIAVAAGKSPNPARAAQVALLERGITPAQMDAKINATKQAVADAGHAEMAEFARLRLARGERENGCTIVGAPSPSAVAAVGTMADVQAEWLRLKEWVDAQIQEFEAARGAALKLADAAIIADAAAEQAAAKSAGVTLENFRLMSPKERRLAAHRARLAGH